MPQYLNSQGQTVSASEATFDGKRTRPGYSAIVADGERVRMKPGDYLGFNIDMVDHRPSASSVFLTDAKKEADAEVKLAVAMDRASHRRKFAFMGDQAPAFNEQASTVRAQAKINDAATAADRDTIRRNQYL